MACTISVHILPYHVIMVTKRIKEICLAQEITSPACTVCVLLQNSQKHVVYCPSLLSLYYFSLNI